MNTEVKASVESSIPGVDSVTASSARRKKRSWLHSIKILALVALLGYLGVLVFLAANETKLVYPGSKYPRGTWEPVDFNHQEIDFPSKDGTRLVGWHLKKPESILPGNPDRTVLLCHGNAENVAESAGYIGDYLRQSLVADVFVFDYRGYGKCDGSPTEAGVLADSEAALEWICHNTGKSPQEIIIVGHSLGGGPAVHLASQHGCRVLVLQRTFSSITDAAQLNYPWLPVRYVMRNQYPSAEKIKTCDCPLYQSHGSEDQLIPIELARKLFRNSPSKTKSFNELPGLGHYDPLPPEYWYELREFVNQVDPPARVDSTARETPSVQQ